MNKKILLLPFLLTSACTKKENVISFSSVSIRNSSTISHEYTEINNLIISWDEIFEMKDENYFVYIFSRTCSHCQSMKNEIIEFAINFSSIYFVEDSEKIVFKNDIKYTIGLTSAENLAIVGFPTLLEIKDKILVKNAAGKEKIFEVLKM